MTAYQIGPDGEALELAGAGTTMASLGPDGALLVPPEGIIARRSAARVDDPG